MEKRIYVGSYSKGCDEGIAQLLFDAKKCSLQRTFGFRGIVNPSFVLCNGAMLYAVEEVVPQGCLHVLQIKEHSLVHMLSLPTYGADPCHISLFSKRKMLLVSNYSSGSLAVYQLSKEGMPTFLQVIQHEGCGPDPLRQQCAHIHFSQEWNGLLAVVDLGMDTVSFYQPVAAGLEKVALNISLPSGMGPRHLVYTPDFPDMLYVCCELGNAVAVCRFLGDRFSVVQVMSTLADYCSDNNLAAAIRVYNHRLYVSNRGNNTICAYDILADGSLSPAQTFSCGGDTPRDFQVFGNCLLSANQNSNNIAIIPMVDGLPTSIGQRKSLEFQCPTCIALAE